MSVMTDMDPIDLWLDDERSAPEGWTWVKTISAAKEYLRIGAVEKFSMDHDLGIVPDKMLQEPSGYALVLWMAKNELWSRTKPKVHSANPPATEAMEMTITRYWDPAHHGPWWLKEGCREEHI